MTYDFKFVPTSGPLSGKSFEQQTEIAINELGNRVVDSENTISDIENVANNALTTANVALTTANDALGIANGLSDTVQTAQTTADNALQGAQSAQTTADSALQGAQNAQTTADNALQGAQNAQNTALNSETLANQAIITADSASNQAAVAESIARTALDLQSGDFIIRTESVDANLEIFSNRIFARNGITNAPVTDSAYLQVMAISDGSAVTQWLWTTPDTNPYRRSGTNDWDPLPGDISVIVDVSPLEGAAATGEMVINNDGLVMSASMTLGIFTQIDAQETSLTGTIEIDVGEDFSGDISLSLQRVITVLDGQATLVFAGAMSVSSDDSNSVITFSNPLFAVDKVSFDVVMTWEAVSPTTTWGEWGRTTGGGGGGGGGTTATEDSSISAYVYNNGGPQAQMNLKFLTLTVFDSSWGNPITLPQTILFPGFYYLMTNAVQAGGIDTGTVAASTNYWVHIIHNPTSSATDVLFSLKRANPVLPAGYTHSRVVTLVRTKADISDTANAIEYFSHLNGYYEWSSVRLMRQISTAYESFSPSAFLAIGGESTYDFELGFKYVNTLGTTDTVEVKTASSWPEYTDAPLTFTLNAVGESDGATIFQRYRGAYLRVQRKQSTGILYVYARGFYLNLTNVRLLA